VERGERKREKRDLLHAFVLKRGKVKSSRARKGPKEKKKRGKKEEINSHVRNQKRKEREKEKRLRMSWPSLI